MKLKSPKTMIIYPGTEMANKCDVCGFSATIIFQDRIEIEDYDSGQLLDIVTSKVQLCDEHYREPRVKIIYSGSHY